MMILEHECTALEVVSKWHKPQPDKPGDLVQMKWRDWGLGIVISIDKDLRKGKAVRLPIRRATVMWNDVPEAFAGIFTPYVPLIVAPTIFSSVTIPNVSLGASICTNKVTLK